MIIKVVELVENDQYTEYADGGAIVKREKKYGLVENFLNISKIVSFREVDRKRYYNHDGDLPEGLIESQQFTYISLAGTNRGVTVVDSPQSLQEKINTISTLRDDKQNLLRG
jgi:hypothetical protein